MTDQSRVEAVQAALLWARDRGLDPHDKQMAQAAIEANDAWLKARWWKSVPELATDHMVETVARLGVASPRHIWGAMWDAAPEEPDQ